MLKNSKRKNFGRKIIGKKKIWSRIEEREKIPGWDNKADPGVKIRKLEIEPWKEGGPPIRTKSEASKVINVVGNNCCLKICVCCWSIRATMSFPECIRKHTVKIVQVFDERDVDAGLAVKSRTETMRAPEASISMLK